MFSRFGKVFHFISISLFLFTLLYFYAAMSEFVSFQLDQEGNPTGEVTKGTFFYIAIIVFGLLNFLLVIPAKLIENNAVQSLNRLFPVGDTGRDYLLAWIYSFIGVVNISLSVMVLFIHAINNQNEIAAGQYSFFFYLIPILFLFWIIALFWILLQKFNSIRNSSI